MGKATLCHVIKGKKILLKKATRGISKGMWNAAGGKVDKGETPLHGAIREVFEETGLKVKKPFYHGKIYFYFAGSKKPDIIGYLYSAREFSGKLKSTEEGLVKWFDISKIPYDKMWDDDKYWIEIMLAGKKFDAWIHFAKDGKVREARILSR
jgi:8-oxo-dGTP pyrophosphatase MutT (NUDIX family)